MLEVKLKLASGKHQGQVIPLTARKFLIGREHDCQLRTNSDLVSRHHCVFNIDDFGVRLRDLGSTNGTLVNGERIREVELHSGDRVQVGKLSFEVVVNPKQVAEGTLPPTVAIESSAAPAITERETVSLQAEETQYELPTPAPAPGAETQYELPVPSAGADPGDTTIGQQPSADQQALAYPPGYAPPGMYPQWPYGAPGQYYAAPYGYPPPGYPPQYPGYPPQYAAPPAPSASGQTGQAVVAPPVRLPPPEATGAVDAPKPVETKSESSQEPAALTPSQRAAEIIKQRTRRG